MFTFNFNNCKIMAFCDTIFISITIFIKTYVYIIQWSSFPHFLMRHGILPLTLVLYPIAFFCYFTKIIYLDNLKNKHCHYLQMTSFCMFYLLIYDSLVDNRLHFGLFLRSALCLRFGLYWVFGLDLLSWNHLSSLVCESINTPDCVSGTYVAKNASTRRKKTW